MLCTIYFVDIITFVRGMPPPPLDVDEEMVEATVGEGCPQVQILANMWRRPNIRFKMELGD